TSVDFPRRVPAYRDAAHRIVLLQRGVRARERQTPIDGCQDAPGAISTLLLPCRADTAHRDACPSCHVRNINTHQSIADQSRSLCWCWSQHRFRNPGFSTSSCRPTTFSYAMSLSSPRNHSATGTANPFFLRSRIGRGNTFSSDFLKIYLPWFWCNFRPDGILAISSRSLWSSKGQRTSSEFAMLARSTFTRMSSTR